MTDGFPVLMPTFRMIIQNGHVYCRSCVDTATVDMQFASADSWVWVETCGSGFHQKLGQHGRLQILDPQFTVKAQIVVNQ